MKASPFPLALLSCFFANSACGPAGKNVAVDIAACAAGEVPAVVAATLPNVVEAIQGTDAQWSSEVATLELSGENFAICSVEAAIHELSRPVAAAMSTGAIAAREKGIARGRAYLASKGIAVSVQAPPTAPSGMAPGFRPGTPPPRWHEAFAAQP